jgi:hypothetical protein
MMNTSSWPSRVTDTLVLIVAIALVARVVSGLNFPLVYIAHEVPKGRTPNAASRPAGTIVTVPSVETGNIVGPVPPPASSVELSERLSRRAGQVFQTMGRAIPLLGAIAVAPFALAVAAAGALATLDPIVFGAIPAVSAVDGEPAAWFVLARWDW